MKKLSFFMMFTLVFAFNASVNLDNFDVISLKDFLNSTKNVNNILNSKKELMKKDYKYDFKIYIDGDIRTGKDLTDNYTNTTSFTEESIKIHLDKLIYDSVNDQITKYIQELDKINYVNETQRQILTKVNIYTDLLKSQMNILILKKILNIRLDIYKYKMKRYQKGMISKIKLIDSKIALLNIKERLIDEFTKYYSLQVLIKNFFEFSSKKLYYVLPYKCDIPNNVKKKILDIKQRKLSYYPVYKDKFPIKVDFYSFAGYAISSDNEFDFNNKYNSANWEIGLHFYVPIYNKEYERNIELSKLNYLEKINKIKNLQKDYIKEVNNLLISIKFYKQKLIMYKEKLNLINYKIDDYNKRVNNGINEFVDFKNTQIELYEEMLKYYDLLYELNKKCKELNIYLGSDIE